MSDQEVELFAKKRIDILQQRIDEFDPGNSDHELYMLKERLSIYEEILQGET